MNKTQLIDALAARLGDRRTAATAVDGLLDTIVETVRAGDTVSLTGFGIFEARARAARVARNPRTGEVVDVPATTVPAFRPGAGFRTAVGGDPAAAHRASPAVRASTVAEAEPAPLPAASARSDDSSAVAAPRKKGDKAQKQAKAAKRDTDRQAKSKDDKPKGKKK